MGSGPHTPTQFFWEYPPPPGNSSSQQPAGIKKCNHPRCLTCSFLGEGQTRYTFFTTYEARKIISCHLIACSRLSVNGRGIEWSIENDASRKISAQSQNLGILNKSLGISGSLYVEQSRSLDDFYNLKSCCSPATNVYSLPFLVSGSDSI